MNYKPKQWMKDNNCLLYDIGMRGTVLLNLIMNIYFYILINDNHK